jgi:transposase-like protein
MQADRNYAGLIAKNPVNPHWRTLENSNLAYDLGELADYVELPKNGTKEPEIITNLKGRNCSLFDTLRHWSYKAVREYWRPGQPGHYPDWFADVLAKARDLNAFEGKEPLGEREIVAIAKSVAAWTWQHMTPDAQNELIQRTHTAELQTARVQKRWQTEKVKAEALQMLAAGSRICDVAAALGNISDRTIKRWRAGPKNRDPKKGII